MAKRTRTLKVFCSKQELREHSHDYDLIEPYEGFLLVRASAATAKKLGRNLPTEDITDQYAIKVQSGKINTNKPRVDAHGKTCSHIAYRGVKKLPPGKHHYLVQFIGPIKPAWLARFRKLGAEPRAPHAGFTYIVRCNEKVLAKCAAARFVRWVGHLSHRDRVQIGDPRRALPRTRTLEGAYSLEFFGRADMRKASSAIRKLGARILSKDENALVMTVEIDSSKAKRIIAALSAIHGVRAIRPKSFKRTCNDVAAGIMDAGGAWEGPLNLSGRGEVVAVCDTGLDTGDKNNIHEDFEGRVTAIKSYPIGADLSPFIRNPGGDDGSADVDSGHGTHVAGSVLGSGEASSSLNALSDLIRGLAYDARLVFQAVEQEVEWKKFSDERRYGRFMLAGIPDDLRSLFRYAYNKGARIHSNSWGGGEPGEYDAQSRQLDDYVWKKKDFCIVVAVGNDGTDKDGDGTINPTSVTSPATAKNCITVGASENRRPQFNGERYGDWWPDDYPVAPYNNAPMANGPNQVVAFSSRGPTRDGRTKPDVVAPGTFILSTRSRRIPLSHTGWAAFPASRQYFFMGGTSMATPLVSGAVALLREFLRRWVGYPSPSAALLKASLVLGTQKLSGYSPATQLSDNDQGYGRVDLDAVAAPPAGVHVYFVDERTGLRTGQVDEFDFRITSSSEPLRVAMAYSDYPGDSLVNNLNLMLVDPEGRFHVGNGSGGGSLAMDSTNNLEMAHVRRPRVGTWKVRVVGASVPHGPQEYAFALKGKVTV